MNHLDRTDRLGDPNKGPSGALKRRRQRAQAFRDLSPECERLVLAMLRSGAIEADEGELPEQVARFMVAALPSAIESLAECVEQWTDVPVAEVAYMLAYPPGTPRLKATVGW